MPNTKTGGNRWVPDIRSENIDTYEESYNGQVEEYKLVNVHPIINGILDKTSFFRTHAGAVWYNRLKNITVLQKLDNLTTNIGALTQLATKDKTSLVSAINEINDKLPISSKIIYVSASGSDETGDGTQAKPYRQISYALAANPRWNAILVEIHVSAGTYNAFSVTNRRVAVILEGKVTIKPEKPTSNCINVSEGGHLAVSASVSDTYELIFDSSTYGIYVSHFSELSVSSTIKKVTFNNISSIIVYATTSSHVTFNADFTVSSTCGPNATIFASYTGSDFIMRFSAASGLINTTTPHAFAAQQLGRFYLRYVNISSKCEIGMHAWEGGMIQYSGGTNSAKTPISTGSGGRIFGGTQSNTPNY